MNNTDLKLHYLQTQILKSLTSNTGLRFNDLLIPGLGSEHMNYHLQKLISLGLVIKVSTLYTLTDTGKDYSNLLDDNVEILEKQPKTSIIIKGIRTNANGEVEHLLTKRLRHPYFGKVGRITGKVKFGETFQQAAARELYEETGLSANFFQLDKIYHKLRHREDGNFIQDVIFYIFLVKEFSGELITKTPHQENFWMTKKEVELHPELDLFEDLEVIDEPETQQLTITETVALATGF